MSRNVHNSSRTLAVKRVSKVFGPITALENVSMTVKSGTIHAVLGPNGSGKTTLLRIISGLVRPDNGHVEVSGKDIQTDILRSRLSMAIVPDEDDLIEDLTPLEYLEFVGQLYDMERSVIKERSDRALKLVGLWQQRNLLCKGFSHGMKKKVQLCSALLPKVDFFIIDEPTNGLDPDVIVLVRKILTSLKQNGATILLATHNLAFAQAVADDVTVLRKEVFAQGRLKNVLAKAHTHDLETAYMKLTKQVIDDATLQAVTAH